MKRKILKLLAALACCGIVGTAYATCYFTANNAYCTVANITTQWVSWECSSAGTVTYQGTDNGVAVENIQVQDSAVTPPPTEGYYYSQTGTYACLSPTDGDNPRWYVEYCGTQIATVRYPRSYAAVVNITQDCPYFP
jgi:hypothetical protein